MKWWHAALSAALVASAGCLPVRYVTQATVGQAEIDESAVPIDELLAGRHVTGRTARLLAAVRGIKAFGERHGLRPTTNYTRYVNLHRDQVVWVVSASPPLELRAKHWRFPIVGSFTYLGWFDRGDARAFAADTQRDGWDVDVRPSSAYSTLGWFEDSVLSTMIHEGDEALGELAEVILHESLHATFYVPGQSTLNESVAQLTGALLAEKWLDENVGPESPEREAYAVERARDEAWGQIMREGYRKLEALYASREPDAVRLQKKAAILADLQLRVAAKHPINNATLVQFETYGSGKAELTELLALSGHDWRRFLARLDAAKPELRAAEEHSDPETLLRPVVARARLERPSVRR